jgi:hypothetical protein
MRSLPPLVTKSIGLYYFHKCYTIAWQNTLLNSYICMSTPLKGSDDGVTLGITEIPDFVHRPEFEISRKHNVSETGYVSVFR